MVLGIIAKEAFRQGTRLLRQYYQVEGKAFNKLYTGFPRARTIGRGVRHGLTAGSITGNLIAPDSPGNDKNGFQEKQSKSKPASYKQNKTRYRQTVRNCPGYNRSYKYRRSR